MSPDQQRKLRTLEGRTISLALADGSRLDSAALISARGRTLWVFTKGEDAFLPVGDVIDAWESQPQRCAA
ncbi:MAG: hypothetical protein ABR540_04225 [Acidimicrobiales bacterium]|nr:hypothetical protein [Actinomycetota bacterium]